MTRRTAFFGLCLALTLTLVPLMPRGVAQAAGPVVQVTGPASCDSWSVGFRTTISHSMPMPITISSVPYSQFSFILRVQNTGMVVGRLLATTDDTGKWEGALTTILQPKRATPGILAFKEVGCNFPPNYAAVTIEPS